MQPCRERVVSLIADFNDLDAFVTITSSGNSLKLQRAETCRSCLGLQSTSAVLGALVCGPWTKFAIPVVVVLFASKFLRCQCHNCCASLLCDHFPSFDPAGLQPMPHPARMSGPRAHSTPPHLFWIRNRQFRPPLVLPAYPGQTQLVLEALITSIHHHRAKPPSLQNKLSYLRPQSLPCPRLPRTRVQEVGA